VFTRLGSDARTRSYLARRLDEGLSRPEIVRSLKRYVARGPLPTPPALTDLQRRVWPTRGRTSVESLASPLLKGDASTLRGDARYGTATEIRAQRAATLDAAYAANPARFRHQPPSPPKLPTVAWINEPSPEALIQSA
jgi:hypothetical protein